MEQDIFESVRYSAMCQDCGDELECCGVQALQDSRLRWDVESTCSACGFTVAMHGRDLPSERREQILTEHGPATLRVLSPTARSAVIMRVLRAELGTDLVNAKSVLRRVLSGDFSGTLPEMELLARKLRASGIPALSTRP
ncbi:hypothetical protein [Streptomyces ehimensis]|uniref:Uncharacterized protein n=1 Tax=Streptomyces ehimensis TaxID=68195 RepID=A0ABV9BUA1_9ACTN